MKSKKASEFMSDETLGLILGAACVIVLVLLFFAILAPIFDKARETGKSYIKSLNNEITKVDSGKTGSFEMIDLKEENSLNKIESYLIYFGESYNYRVEGEVSRLNQKKSVSWNFFRPSFDKNLICVCVISLDSINKHTTACYMDECSILKAPAVFENSNGGRWGIGEGVKLEIKFENGKYVFEKAE